MHLGVSLESFLTKLEVGILDGFSFLAQAREPRKESAMSPGQRLKTFFLQGFLFCFWKENGLVDRLLCGKRSASGQVFDGWPVNWEGGRGHAEAVKGGLCLCQRQSRRHVHMTEGWLSFITINHTSH